MTRVLRPPALEITQAPGIVIYLFAADGKQLGQFASVAQIGRGGPGALLSGYQRHADRSVDLAGLQHPDGKVCGIRAAAAPR